MLCSTFSGRDEYLYDHFIERSFKKAPNHLSWYQPLIISVFSNQIKDRIGKWLELKDNIWPDFAIIKHIELEEKWLYVRKLKFTGNTSFSMWNIEEDDTSRFPFSPVRKNQKVMRIPEHGKKSKCWLARWDILIR